MLMASLKAPDPNRFEVSKSTLLVDSWMEHFIKIGGIGIIIAVFGIFIFILLQVLPLFKGATVKEIATYSEIQSENALLLGVDEWTEKPFTVNKQGAFTFYDITQDTVTSELVDVNWRTEFTATVATYEQATQTVAIGTDDGRVAIANVEYEPVFDEKTTERTITYKVSRDGVYDAGISDAPITALSIDDSEIGRMIAVIQETDGQNIAYIKVFRKKTSLMGRTRITEDGVVNVNELGIEDPQIVMVNALSKRAVVADSDGHVHVIERADDDSFKLSYSFRPFEGEANPRVQTMSFLLGQASLLMTSAEGTQVIFTTFRDQEAGVFRYVQSKSFPSLEGPQDFFATSMRNRSFITGHGRDISLRYGTTESTRWTSTVDFDIEHCIISGKHDRILLLEDAGLHVYSLYDPHPEASLGAYFGKVHYENAKEGEYIWQSTGGSNEEEPKLSMVPLMIGSLKGTLYALLFAVPIALMSAVYSSQFLNPGIKKYIKPAMEIMASLPSVVLGFLGALWLAPLIEDRFPSVLLMIICLPAFAFFFGWAWQKLPVKFRILVRPGFEFIIFMPLLITGIVICWHAGPALEKMLFVVTDPSTGKQMADFRLWWPEVMGIPYDQRNSLIVGFMVGFAVIPIIFTISDDAMSNVPQTLTSGSLALGASRWQTAIRVVLPTASAGIFSALMIAFGRAVGETMIYVMATGNTPIVDHHNLIAGYHWNIFNGFRALSANIAVEMPEAPKGGTLYRTLFLGALILFMFTFIINTVAEVLRSRLQNRYKTVG